MQTRIEVTEQRLEEHLFGMSVDISRKLNLHPEGLKVFLSDNLGPMVTAEFRLRVFGEKLGLVSVPVEVKSTYQKAIPVTWWDHLRMRYPKLQKVFGRPKTLQLEVCSGGTEEQIFNFPLSRLYPNVGPIAPGAHYAVLRTAKPLKLDTPEELV